MDLISTTNYLEGDSELLNIIGNKSNHHTYNTSNDIIVSDYKFKISNPLIIVILFFKRVLQKIIKIN